MNDVFCKGQNVMEPFFYGSYLNNEVSFFVEPEVPNLLQTHAFFILLQFLTKNTVAMSPSH
jgi:hypothetical protein